MLVVIVFLRALRQSNYMMTGDTHDKHGWCFNSSPALFLLFPPNMYMHVAYTVYAHRSSRGSNTCSYSITQP